MQQLLNFDAPVRQQRIKLVSLSDLDAAYRQRCIDEDLELPDYMLLPCFIDWPKVDAAAKATAQAFANGLAKFVAASLQVQEAGNKKRSRS